MAGIMGKATFPVKIPLNVNKIEIIKAFRDFADAMTWNGDMVRDKRYELEREIADVRARLQELEGSYAQYSEEIQRHESDPYFFSDRVDEVSKRYHISARAKSFLCYTSKGLKDQKDAVELMIATGDILGSTEYHTIVYEDNYPSGYP